MNLLDFIQRSTLKIRMIPAVVALIVQCSAFLCVIVFSAIFSVFSVSFLAWNIAVPIYSLVLLQALFAAAFSQVFGMESWWRWINFTFPIAIWLMSGWHVPSEVYFIGFIVSLSLYWTTFRTQVPFYPSRPIVWKQALRHMPAKNSKVLRVIDIGSGLGDMAMYIAKQRSDCLVEGMEIAPLPWLISYVRAKIFQSKARFVLGDYHRLNFANYDVVFAYLSPAAMQSLWQKAQAEMSSGSLLMSYEFEIPNVPPSLIVPTGEKSPKLYVWRMGG